MWGVYKYTKVRRNRENTGRRLLPDADGLGGRVQQLGECVVIESSLGCVAADIGLHADNAVLGHFGLHVHADLISCNVRLKH